MSIDLNQFTPWSALGGGVMIGLAAGLLIIGAGRIAGVSGIVGALLQPPHHKDIWRWCFLAGLLISAWLLKALGFSINTGLPAAQPLILAMAGLLVGIGTRYAAGCTSGHGVCGLSRLSMSSLIATITFMMAGFITVYVVRHLIQ